MSVSTPPSQLPPPMQPPQPGSPTQVVGQQVAPSTSVPVTSGPIYTANPGQTNSLAVVSLVAGIGSFFAHIIPGIGGLTVAIVAIVTGYMARNQIKKTGEQGYGLATAGMIIGIIHVALIALVVIGLIFAIFVFGIALFGISSRSSG
jgi:predicted anti-sigma-YlaC factor YlaD